MTAARILSPAIGGRQMKAKGPKCRESTIWNAPAKRCGEGALDSRVERLFVTAHKNLAPATGSCRYRSRFCRSLLIVIHRFPADPSRQLGRMNILRNDPLRPDRFKPSAIEVPFRTLRSRDCDQITRRRSKIHWRI